jgi:hypothetical protein
VADIRGDQIAVHNTNVVAASGVVKATPGTVYGFTVMNSNGATRYFQLYNLAAVPSDAAVPFMSFELATGTSKTIDFGVYGCAFSVGVCWANSSTNATKTIGSADSLVTILYS